MDKVYLMHEHHPLGITFALSDIESDHLTGATRNFESRTPNCQMEKRGSDRFPFTSERISVHLKPKLICSTKFGTKHKLVEKPAGAAFFYYSSNAATPEGGDACINAGGYASCEMVDNVYQSFAKGFYPYYKGIIYYDTDIDWWHHNIHLTYYEFRNGQLYCRDLDEWRLARDGMIEPQGLEFIINGGLPVENWGYDLDDLYRTYPDSYGVRVENPEVDDLVLELARYAASSAAATHDLGVLSAKVINQFKITDVNIPAYLFELPELGRSSIEAISNAISAAGSATLGEAMKHLAKSNLAYQYGDRLSLYDTQDIVECISETSRRMGVFAPRTAKVISTKPTTGDVFKGTDTFRYTVTAHPDDKLSKSCYALANVFNVANTWDMIPFSFVVDWFVNLDDAFQAADARTLSHTLSYDRIIESRCLQGTIDSYELIGVPGHIEYFKYTRNLGSTMPPPDAKLQASIPSAVQWLNGGSLLTQVNWAKR